MNKIVHRAILTTSVLLTLNSAAISAGPPNNDVSDASGNTAGGTNALINNSPSPTTGYNNTAFGRNALFRNTTGTDNTAAGAWALANNTTGFENSACGFEALTFNTTGTNNAATGKDALWGNTTGSFNTADGSFALYNNTTGSNNTASGFDALFYNTIGSYNTTDGYFSLFSNTNGIYNTASGVFTLFKNTTGSYNTALGSGALENTTTGFSNTAVGFNSLVNSIGNNNIALGLGAGSNMTNGDNNIYLGNSGAATESNTMRLGSVQTTTFMAGVAGVPVSGSQVLITSTGKLGILASSARYKHDIRDMGGSSRKLRQLRPVTFRYNQDAQGVQQYGLIAEEVAKVYPELVVRRADGTVETVQYHELVPMLLNEYQHQQQEITALKAQNKQLQAALLQQNAALAARVEQLEAAAHRATMASR